LRGGRAPPPQEETEAKPTSSPPRGRVAWQRARREAAALELGPKVAVIATFSCLNAGADFCATCVERCPEPGALRLDGRRVVVDADVCNGCGVCVPLCPAPGGAILLKPAA
jgi:Pyruvate/2-oxoacid:ferredoxin oxidoreductase delta subunit